MDEKVKKDLVKIKSDLTIIKKGIKMILEYLASLE